MGGNELHDAVADGDLEQVMHLVEKRGFNVEEKDYCDWTPLHMAAERGHFEVARYLVEQGHANYGSTPLHWAAHKGYLEIVKYFVEQAHADIWIKDDKGRTACDLATEEIKEYLKKLMEDEEGGLTMTKSAAFNPFTNNKIDDNDNDNDYNNGNDKLENESKNFNCSIMK